MRKRDKKISFFQMLPMNFRGPLTPPSPPLEAKERNRVRSWFHTAAAAGILLLAGCAVGPDYKRPPVPSPPAYRGEESKATNSLGDLPWWEVFHDEKLQTLVRTALTNNFDVRIAATRVEQARALVAQARSQLFPQLNYFAGAGKGRNVGANNTLSPNGGVTAGAMEFGGNVSWEIDLWGQVRRMTEAARAQFFASQEAQRDVRISLIAQVAQSYFQLLTLDRELAIAKEATNSYGESLRIFNERLQGGVASKLESSTAEALLASSAAMIPDLERQIVQTENQLGVLLGENPGPIVREGSVLEKQTAPEVPAGLPSSLLERRPDIRRGRAILARGQRATGRGEVRLFSAIEPDGNHRPGEPGTGDVDGGQRICVGRGGEPDGADISRRPVAGAVSAGGSGARPVRAAIPIHRAERAAGSCRRAGGADETGADADRTGAGGGGVPGGVENCDGALPAGAIELLRGVAGAAVAFPGGEHAGANAIEPTGRRWCSCIGRWAAGGTRRENRPGKAGGKMPVEGGRGSL